MVLGLKIQYRTFLTFLVVDYYFLIYHLLTNKTTCILQIQHQCPLTLLENPHCLKWYDRLKVWFSNNFKQHPDHQNKMAWPNVSQFCSNCYAFIVTKKEHMFFKFYMAQ